MALWLAWLVGGVVLGAATIGVGWRFDRAHLHLNVLVAVIAMNGIYVGAGLADSIPAVLAETAVATGVCTVAIVAYHARSQLLALTVLLHAAVDGLHGAFAADVVPEWYVVACLGFDVVYAAIAWRLLGDRSPT